jgi:hypothetical protein
LVADTDKLSSALGTKFIDILPGDVSRHSTLKENNDIKSTANKAENKNFFVLGVDFII